VSYRQVGAPFNVVDVLEFHGIVTGVGRVSISTPHQCRIDLTCKNLMLSFGLSVGANKEKPHLALHLGRTGTSPTTGIFDSTFNTARYRDFATFVTSRSEYVQGLAPFCCFGIGDFRLNPLDRSSRSRKYLGEGA